MKFGIMLANFYDVCTQVESVLRAEELGYDSVFVIDQYVVAGGGDSSVHHTAVTPVITYYSLDQLTLLSYLAGITSKIKLGTGVCLLPLRPPGIVAKMVATIDVLSGGRCIFGVGMGWSKHDWLLNSNDWSEAPERVRKTDEALQLIIKLWKEDKVDFKGRYYSTEAAVLDPKPLQKPHPPIWVGGYGNKMLRMTAQFADGWLCGPLLEDDDLFREKIAKIHGYQKELNQEHHMTIAAIGAFVPDMKQPGLPKDFYYPIHGGLKDCAKRIEARREAGCEHYILWPLPEQKSIELTEQFARDIIPSF